VTRVELAGGVVVEIGSPSDDATFTLSEAPSDDRRAITVPSVSDALAELTPSTVVELNRAVAHSMAFGPTAGLVLVEALTSEPSLRNYHLLPSVRGELLAKLGRLDEARAEFERAASLTQNARERELLLDRATASARASAPPAQ